MLNYRLQAMTASGPGTSSNFINLASETGINNNNWIFRSRQSINSFNGNDSFTHQAAWVQHTFTDLNKVMQAGQISLSNSLFGTGQVYGIQMQPENALNSDTDAPIQAEGIADETSLIEVRQAGLMIYSTQAPAGPFSLRGLPLVNTRTDLDLTITSSSGKVKHFKVPAASLRTAPLSKGAGLSIGIGKIYGWGSLHTPIVATAAKGYRLGENSLLTGGAFASAPWRALAASVEMQPNPGTQLGFQITIGQQVEPFREGSQFSLQLSQALTEKFSLGVNFSEQTRNYRELNDALQSRENDAAYTRRQHSLTTNWNDRFIGSFSLSWARSEFSRGKHIDYLRTGWGRQWDNVSFSLSFEQSVSGKASEAEKRGWLSLSLPIGRSSQISSYLLSDQRHRRQGTRFSQRLSDTASWGLSAEHELSDNRFSGTLSGDIRTRVSHLNGSVGIAPNNRHSMTASASGGLALHKGGLTLSSGQISDTFGIAKVGFEPDVPLITPSGTAWSDSRGYAVIPTLNAFSRNGIQVETRALSRNVDMPNAYQESWPARGTVEEITFNMVHTRRVLVNVLMQGGGRLPEGAAVFDHEDKLVTVVGADGSLFLPDAVSQSSYSISTNGRPLCEFSLTLPESPTLPKDELYEHTNTYCNNMES